MWISLKMIQKLLLRLFKTVQFQSQSMLLLIGNSTSAVLSRDSVELTLIMEFSSLATELRRVLTSGSSKIHGALAGVRKATLKSKETWPLRDLVSVVSKWSHHNQFSEHISDN